VPVTIVFDHPAQHASPESALGREIRRVEGDDLIPDPHRPSLPGNTRMRTYAIPEIIEQTSCLKLFVAE